MRVLIVVRPTVATSPGGDAVLAGHAAEALRERGIEVDVAATLTPDAGGYDIAHVFGIFDPDVAEPQVDAIRATDAALVISPIWWDRTALFRLSPLVARALSASPRVADGRLARLRRREDELVRTAGRGARRFFARQAALLRRCDLALAGSIIEEFACAQLLGVDAILYAVARYGLDASAFADAPAGAASDGSARSGVVCIGRIEPLKNQAMLLFALRDVDCEITLVGMSNDADYGALCRRLATPRTRLVDRLPPGELAALLQRTAVHVLPSWGDLPGFVSLEAGALGTQVVAGARGSEREYLGPDATYVDPLDPAGIRAAVVRALDAPPRTPGDRFEQRLRALTWATYAEHTIDAYERARALRSR